MTDSKEQRAESKEEKEKKQVIRSLSRLALLLLFTLHSFLFTLHPAFAKDYDFKRWDVDIRINKQSTFLVEEKITYDFRGDYSGASRSIQLGDNVLEITDFQISNGEKVFEPGVVTKGQVNPPHLFQVIEEGGTKQVNFSFRAIDEEKTFTIKYKVIGGFNYYQNVDEFLWKAIAEERERLIEEVVVTVHLPEEVALTEDKIGLNTDAATSDKEIVDPQTVRFTGSRLAENTKFRIGIKFPKGVIIPNQTLLKQQKAHTEAIKRIRIALPVIICLSFFLLVLVFLLMLWLWWKWGKDIVVPKVADYLPDPPSKTRPAVAGEVLSEGVGIAEINATLIDLARRGYLKIHKQADDTLFEYLEDKGDLNRYEDLLIQSLFQGQKAVSLSSLRNVFYREVPRLRQLIGEEAVREGFFKATPASVRKKYIIAGVLVGVLGGLATLCVGASLASVLAGPESWAANLLVSFPVGAVVLSGIVVAIFGYFMPRRTPLGAEARAKWEAFRTYLKDIKKFGKLERAQEIFENFLPYAVAFGLERVFTNAFTSEEVVPPIWFVPYIGGGEAQASGGGGSVSAGDFSLDQMSDSFFSMLDSTAETLVSSPTSSSSGADFGGGFGGGAGGGGGSDAW